MVAAALLWLGATGPAGAGYEEGMDAFAKGDYDTAYRELRPLALKGEAGAQFTLGFMYDYGQGVPQSSQEAIWWYRNAAEQGIAVAQFSLGEIYEAGRGTPKDLTEAFRWYSLAAENLTPGEIRDSVTERRDAVAAKLTPAQMAIARTLLGKAAADAPQAAAGPADDAGKGSPPAGAQGADAALVAAIQHELARLGYNLSWREGTLDALTRGAIQAFEIETGRPITGKATEAILQALRETERPEVRPIAAAPAQTQPASAADAPRSAEGAPVVVLSEADTGAGDAPSETAEDAASLPSGAAGGPMIPLDQETEPTAEQLAALPESQPESQSPAPAGAEAPEQSGATDGGPQDGPQGDSWDLRFVERQIGRLDEIAARVDGRDAALQSWDALAAWESETRGLLAARLGQETASGLSAQRAAPRPGDPLGTFRRTADAFRTYLSALLGAR